MRDDTHSAYWHPTEGWGAERAGVTRRLDVRLRSRVSRQADVRLRERDVHGVWHARTLDDLGAVERGQAWQVWRMQRQGQALVVFAGQAPLEESVLAQLTDVFVRSEEDGTPLAPLASAGLRLCLADSDASRLVSLLRQEGGLVQMVPPEPGRLEREISAFTTWVQAYEDIVQAHLAILASAATGVMLDVPRIDADAAQLDECAQRAGESRAQAREACEQLRQSPVLADVTAALRGEEQWRVLDARLQRAQASAAAARIVAAQQLLASEGTWPPPLNPAPQSQLAQLAAHWAAAGLPVTLTEEGVIVHTPQGRVQLGEDVQLLPEAP